MYDNSVIFGASYDGFIYAFDKKSGKDLNRIQGPGKPLLHFDVSNNKVSFIESSTKCIFMDSKTKELSVNKCIQSTNFKNAFILQK